MNENEMGESIAVLKSMLDRARCDMNEIADTSKRNHEESGIRINELTKDLSNLRSEMLKYKWIGWGIGTVIASVFAVLNYIGFDYFKKP